MSQKKEFLEEILPRIEEWLELRGLSLNKEKTSIRDIRTEGFSFLGFDIRQFPTTTLRHGSRRFQREATRMAHNKKPGAKRTPTPKARFKEEEVYSCIIKPGKKETYEFIREIGDYLRGTARSQSIEVVIQNLNSKIRGWANHYKFVIAKDIFSKVRHLLSQHIWRFLKRRHPQKSIGWIRRTYFTTIDEDKFNLFAKSSNKRRGDKIILVNIAKDIPIERYVKVTGANSPFDPELSKYWNKRRLVAGKTRFSEGSKLDKVYTSQKGICPVCGEHITGDDQFEIHHILPIKDGGNNGEKNLVILHKACHKAKHQHLHHKR